MEKTENSFNSMLLAVKSLKGALQEQRDKEKVQQQQELSQRKALQDQIKSLEENNKGLVLENKTLSAQNMKLKSKMELIDSQLLESSKKMSESIAYATELEHSMIKKERQSLNARARLLVKNEKLQNDINDLITCQICDEQFQSAGEHIPCKLKCPHILCKKCAEHWLTMVPGRANCPTCNKLYTKKNISPINLNYDL